MSNKNNKRPNKYQSLSKNQRNKQNGRYAPASKKGAVAKKSIFATLGAACTALLAVICVMAIVCTSFAGAAVVRFTKPLVSKWKTSLAERSGDAYLSNYETMTLGRYLDTTQMGKVFYTGNQRDFDQIYATLSQQKKYTPLTAADMDNYIENVLIANRGEAIKTGQKQTVVGVGDDVAIYITDILDKDGKRIPTSVMSIGSYTGAINFTVGLEYFGQGFDDAIIKAGIIPASTGREVRQNGSITLDDTVCITYKLYKSTTASKTPDAADPVDRYEWETSAKQSKSQARVSLSDSGDIDQILAAAIVDNMPAIGEKYSFVLEDYAPTSNATDKGTYRVDATVSFAVAKDENGNLKEYTESLTFAFPDDFFEGGDGNDLLAMNGETVTFKIIVIGSDDYELPKFDRAFITETLEMEIEATDDAGAVAEYREKQLKAENEARAKALRSEMFRQLYLGLSNAATALKYYVNTQYTTSLTAPVQQAGYQELLNAFVSTYGVAPTENALHAFAIDYAAAQGAQVQSYSEYLQLYVQSNVSQELLMYHVFRDAGLKVTKAQVEEAYAEYLAEIDELVADYNEDLEEDEEPYTREDFINTYGGETTIKKQLRRELVYETVGAYLLENNTTQPKAES